MEHIYLFTFIIFIPVVWNILMALRFESLFKQGHVWHIRLAYALVSLVGAHLVAVSIESFANAIYRLLNV